MELTKQLKYPTTPTPKNYLPSKPIAKIEYEVSIIKDEIIKGKEIISSRDAFNVIATIWDKKEFSRNLKYKAFILDKNNKMVAFVDTPNVFTIENNPELFFVELEQTFESLKAAEKEFSKGLDTDTIQIIFSRNKIGDNLCYDERMVNLVKQMKIIAPKYGFNLVDMLIIHPTSFISLKNKCGLNLAA